MTSLAWPPSDAAYRRELDGGLVLRWSTAEDVERIVHLYRHVFRDKADDPPNELIAAWTRDMLSGQHPLITPGDAALVEDPARGEVVAATCLLSQTWEYGGISIPVGRPEVVATHPDYRRRGLIRAIFELIHARSEARGDLVQGITGIRYFYRQFGYEFALELGGDRHVFLAAIPALKEGQTEPCRLRDATPADLPHVLALYERERADALVSARIDARYWRYTLDGMNPASREGWRTQLIVDSDERRLGYVLTRHARWGDAIAVCGLSVAAGVSLVAVLPSVLRALRDQAPSTPAHRHDEQLQPARIGFVLGGRHPAYTALGPLAPDPHRTPYAWYVRVPDVPAFIRHIAPVLEQRLAGSILAGHTGELRMDFYNDGLRLVFEDGRLTTAEPWRTPQWEPAAQCGFPPLVFLQLLFGHRGRAELRHIFPDAWANDEARPLLEVLFPPLPSRVWGLE